MTKRLTFILLMIALLGCVFALSVGAVTGSTSSEYGEITYVDGIKEVNEYGTSSRAVLKNADGTYTTYPAHYIYNGSTRENLRLSFSALNNITGEDYKPSSLIRIEVYSGARLNWTFQSCTSLIDVYLPDGVFLHYASFVGCSALESIVLPTTGITQIPTDCFSGCYSLKNVCFPNTVTSFGPRAFQNCVSLSEIKFPEEYTGIIPQDFRKITEWSLERVPVTYIVSKTCTGVNSNFSLDNCDVSKIIFTGTENSDFVKNVTEKAKGWVSKIEYANHCEYYYDGNHTPDLKYVFTSFFEECYMESVCSRCQLTKTEITYNPIFQFNGYSTNGKKICVGYSIDNTSLAKYKENNPDAVFSFGIIATANNNTPINENGEFAEKSINIDLTNTNYASVDFILSGDWNNATNAEAKISMNLYLIEKSEEKPSVSYVYGKMENGELVTKVYKIADGVSYNELNLIKGE